MEINEQKLKKELADFINHCMKNSTPLRGYREGKNPFKIVAFQNSYIVTESIESEYKMSRYALLFDVVLEGVLENKIRKNPIQTPKMFAELIEKSPSKRISQSSTNGAYTKFYFGIYKEFLSNKND